MSSPIRDKVSDVRAQDAIFESQLDVQQEEFEQAVAEQSIKDGMEEEGNPLVAALKKQDKKLEARKIGETSKTKSEVSKAKPLTAKQMTDTADEFVKQNPEFKAKDLLDLLDKLNPDDSKESILKSVFAQYLDITQANKALDFLTKVTGGDLQKQVQGAQQDLFAPINSVVPGDTKETIAEKLSSYPHILVVNQALDILLGKTTGNLRKEVQLLKDEVVTNHGRELAAATNIMAVTQARIGGLQKSGLNFSASELTERYVDLTTNPRELQTLYNELSQMNYKQKISYLNFMLHAAGSDMKSEGPSIERGKLQTLFAQVRMIQAMIFVDKTCQLKMTFIYSQCTAHGVNLPVQVTHELVAKQLMNLISERYPSPEKIGQLAMKLGIDKDIQAQLIVFNTMLLQIIPQLAPNKVFRSQEHMKEVADALVKYNERLEEELEAMEEAQ